MDSSLLFWLTPIISLLPIFFAMGWFTARIDMKTVLKQAKSVPSAFYKSLGALVDGKTNVAATILDDLIEKEQQFGRQIESFELSMTLGKLYRQRGENDKAILLHEQLLNSPHITDRKRVETQFELGLDYQSTGLVDRAEKQFEALLDTYLKKNAAEILLAIYQQDRDWKKAIDLATDPLFDIQTHQFDIAQFYCELAQKALIQSNLDQSSHYANMALDYNKKCARASMILGNIEFKKQNHKNAISYYTAIENQNVIYLNMVGENIYDAYEALNKKEEGFNHLIGYTQTFPQLDLTELIYEKALILYGESKTTDIVIDLIRKNPNLEKVYLLSSFKVDDINPIWKTDAEMVRKVIGNYLKKSIMYRCQHCHFKSQVFFWHCPACNKWETFTPSKIEV